MCLPMSLPTIFGFTTKFIPCNSVYCVTHSRESSFLPGEKRAKKKTHQPANKHNTYTIWIFWFIIQLIYRNKKNHSISLLISLHPFGFPSGNNILNCFHLFMPQRRTTCSSLFYFYFFVYFIWKVKKFTE